MRKNKHLFWGIFFILAALAVIGVQISGLGSRLTWGMAVTGVVLIAVFIASASHFSFTGMLAPLGVAYTVFDNVLGLPRVAGWVPIVFAVLLGIGLDILLSSIRRKRWQAAWEEGRRGWEGYEQIEDGEEGNWVRTNVRFGSLHRYVESKEFRGGEFAVNVGELKVDLTDAVLAAEGAEIRVNCSFGSLEVIVPRNWDVKEDVRASLGGVDSKGRRMAPEPGAPELRILGEVSFGGIEIRYI